MDLTELTNPQVNLFAYSYMEIVLNILVASLLGFAISFMYRVTHRGLSYSQSFTLTILFVTVIVAVVMMVIGGSLARAFALVGALSIIRFRTVIKDTKDTTYVFLALAIGMAAGTSNYFLAFVGTLMIGALILIVDQYNYGALFKSDFVIRFLFSKTESEAGYLRLFEEYTRSNNLLHVEPSGDPDLIRMTFDVSVKEDRKPADFVSALSEVNGLSEVVLIASKSDVDY
ncbi:MAG: DUF4956 domain-containing protein [Gammaproteobacteria bacterium]|jgi:hypothetical protein|nr:DUF4956 domain-containing protein [Gammaproteobacteria bacterium]MBT4492419.1 DUF4956 domain-containing protein [Gammaproteobacteria bacterium]MBT7369314.1 DUF4956 domain-containing protein [Gammaproteobacteria bacterium]